MPFTEVEKTLYMETAELLKGSERRMFMARVVKMLGFGGQRRAERELGWNRGTVRKGMTELERGRPFKSKVHRRGRKCVEAYLPDLLTDIQNTVDTLNRFDPVYQRTNYYTGVTISAVRHCLIDWKGYDDAELPSNETIRVRMRQLGYKAPPVKGNV